MTPSPPEKFICIPVQLIVCFHRVLVPVITHFHQPHDFWRDKRVWFRFYFYSLVRCVFVEDIKKKDIVHLHLITNIIKEVYHVKRNELKILLEFSRPVVFIAPNRHLRRFCSGNL